MYCTHIRESELFSLYLDGSETGFKGLRNEADAKAVVHRHFAKMGRPVPQVVYDVVDARGRVCSQVDFRN